MSAPDPEGRGARDGDARRRSPTPGSRRTTIAYLNLHGTGTPLNDAMESVAVDARVRHARCPCSSTKPLVGHTLGAAGALEAAFCWLVLDRREGGALVLPPHCFDGARDPELPPLRLASRGRDARPRRARRA